MEPTIYKPSIYKGAGGIYKGAGGIYKGRGVYNDVATPPGFFYEFNLSRFDLDTLKDGDVQWICTKPSYLSKGSDCLDINLQGSGFKLLFRPDIDKTRKIIAEFTITLPTINFCYSGLGCAIDGGLDYNFCLYSTGSNTNFQNPALVATIKDYDIYNGGVYSGTWTYNTRIGRFPYSQKQKIKVELTPEGKGKFYIDDVLSLEGDFAYSDYDYFLENFDFYINPEISSGVIKLFSLKIWQE